MGTISVSVPEDLKMAMTRLEEINWSAVARNAFEEKVKEIELFKKIIGRSELTEKDVKSISKKIDESMARKFRSL